MRVAIGQQWRRRVEQHDLWDHVVIVGRFEQPEVDEWVVRPIAGLAPAVSVTAADLAAAFSFEADAPERVEADLAETGGAWV